MPSRNIFRRQKQPKASPQGYPSMEGTIHIRYADQAQTRDLRANHGETLRDVLLRNGISPYARATRVLNCGGRGLCATCGVHILEGKTVPTHWYDRVGHRFGYPRLSCQVTITHDMTIGPVPDK